MNSMASSAIRSPLVSVIIRKTQDLSMDELQAVYRLWKLHVATQYSITDFKNKVAGTFQTAYLFNKHDDDKAVRGCLFSSVCRNKVFEGKRVTIVQPGAGFVENDFRPVAFSIYNQVYMNLHMNELLLDPFTPVYTCIRAFTYKGYMISMRFQPLFPRYNKGIPVFEKRILDDFGRRIGGEHYDPVTGIIRKEDVGIKDGVADIAEERHLSNPHIRFFQKQNPDWKKGHMLCAIGRFTWRNGLEYFARSKRLF